MAMYILILTMTTWDGGGAGIDHIEGLLLEDCKRIGRAFTSSHKFASYQCVKRYGDEE